MLSHPFLDQRDDIRWSTLKPEFVNEDMNIALETARKNIEQIVALGTSGEELGYENTFGALEAAGDDLGWAWGLLSHLTAVCDSEPMREAHGAMLPAVTEFYSGISLNAGLWRVLKAYGESDAVKDLTAIQQRHVEETMADFLESGAGLSDEKKAQLMELESRLAEATKIYSENVLDATNAWELVVEDESELAGLSKTARDAALASAIRKDIATKESPKWRFTLHMPSYFPVIEQAESDSLRETMWRAMSDIGRTEGKDNTDLVWEILRLRQEKATLLGKEHFADFTTSRRMAKTGAAALKFIDDLGARLIDPYREEIKSLEDYRASKLDADRELFEPWQVTYWAERRRREEFAFDDEDTRPYFAVDRVIKGMFDLAERIFGAKIVEVPTVFVEESCDELPDGVYEVWHPEVKAYVLRDVGDAEIRGIFYTDWHPRESKRGGAWMNSLRTGMPPKDGQARIPHIGLMCGNMSPAVDGKPALLTHSEVETVVHEFGHLIHHLFGEVPLKSFNGISVPWDFVELPSQIMENFCWNRESLDLFARHPETGEPLPDELFERMLSARNYMAASTYMRQLSLGKIDLETHINYDELKGRDLDEVDRELLVDYRVPMKTQAPSMLRKFTHLFGHPTGYACGYYSYKWAAVLDADAFTRFENEGVLNPDVGMAFRETILSKGNSIDVAQSYRNFMGRDPDPLALLRRDGLL